jgi:valyl-tRNA synthetase
MMKFRIQNLSKTYNPLDIEARVQKFWKETNIPQRAGNANGDKFIMLFPPPNITGKLHIGHALTIAIQDTIVRYNIMKGKNVKWIPGFDHAGIATQSVVERKLDRRDLQRDELLAECSKWAQEYKGKISEQLNRFGAAFNWDEEIYTIDAKHTRTVQEAFIRLFNDGLIYRDTRIVNWCNELKTTISDVEVDYETIESPRTITLPDKTRLKVGLLHHFKYKILQEESKNVLDEFLHVATTRPETILGDEALAVHPDDARYKQYHGKYALHPIIPGKKIPIVCDSTLVEPEFGTGVVKVTPAHDVADYECAKRHNLPISNLFDFDGSVRSDYACSEFAGCHRLHVRDKVLKHLSEKHLYLKSEAVKTSIAKCSRSGDLIEPMVMPQWFLKCGEMAQKVLSATQEGMISVNPPFYRNNWIACLRDAKDWCISRQLVWGHRIPAYKIMKSGQSTWIAADNPSAANELAQKLYKDNFTILQDTDVLDTWFSSSLLPLTLPKAYYPTSTIESGSDILFFWIARMNMLCFYLKGRPPFSDIRLHPIVRDQEGRKMSKSLGNVIDPLQLIEGRTIEKLLQEVDEGSYTKNDTQRNVANARKAFPNGFKQTGWDSLRFALLDMQGVRSINLDLKRVYVLRNFGNKIWNALRFFVLTAERLEYEGSDHFDLVSDELPPAHQHIVFRLAHCATEVECNLKTWKLCDATESLNKFFVQDFCDKFLEVSKVYINSGTKHEALITAKVLLFIMRNYSLLLHPFMPHLSEELWKELGGTESVLLQDYPSIRLKLNDRKVQEMDKVYGFAAQLRAKRTEAKSERITAKDSLWLRPYAAILTHLSKKVIIFEEESMN